MFMFLFLFMIEILPTVLETHKELCSNRVINMDETRQVAGRVEQAPISPQSCRVLTVAA